ncbi:MAG: MoaD/ThiS family protein [Candidatus Methylomirabilales bacterium]
MASARFWFSSPFRQWIGQRTVTLDWEGTLTLRDVFARLARQHPAFAAHVAPQRLTDADLEHLAAVILDGDFLSLDSPIPDGARVDVLTPLVGG